MSGSSDAAQATGVTFIVLGQLLMNQCFSFVLRAAKSQLPSTAPQPEPTECRLDAGWRMGCTV